MFKKYIFFFEKSIFTVHRPHAVCAILETCDQFNTELLSFTLNKIILPAGNNYCYALSYNGFYAGWNMGVRLITTNWSVWSSPHCVGFFFLSTYYEYTNTSRFNEDKRFNTFTRYHNLRIVEIRRIDPRIFFLLR